MGTSPGASIAPLPIRGVLDTLVERAARWFARLLETPASRVEHPAVAEATEPAVRSHTLAQVGVPVRAVDADQARLPGLVPVRCGLW